MRNRVICQAGGAIAVVVLMSFPTLLWAELV